MFLQKELLDERSSFESLIFLLNAQINSSRKEAKKEKCPAVDLINFFHTHIIYQKQRYTSTLRAPFA